MSEGAPGEPMSVEAAHARYDRISAAIMRVVQLAGGALGRSDLERAAKKLGLNRGGEIQSDEESGSAFMIFDLALFEPNQRGKRAFDRFLAQRALQLAAEDLAMAKRMSGAAFSLLAYDGQHETVGLWMLDRLDGDRRIWLVGTTLEQSPPDHGAVFGMRVFDAGPFHLCLGVAAAADIETVGHALTALRGGGTMPFQSGLAAQCYLDALTAAITPEIEHAMIESLTEALENEASGGPSSPNLAAPGRRRPDPTRH